MGEIFAYEKPWTLLSALLKRFLMPNTKQVVFEAFGGMGPASVASIHNEWDFIYCESNEINYGQGLSRIDKALEVNDKKPLIIPKAG